MNRVTFDVPALPNLTLAIPIDHISNGLPWNVRGAAQGLMTMAVRFRGVLPDCDEFLADLLCMTSAEWSGIRELVLSCFERDGDCWVSWEARRAFQNQANRKFQGKPNARRRFYNAHQTAYRRLLRSYRRAGFSSSLWHDSCSSHPEVLPQDEGSSLTGVLKNKNIREKSRLKLMTISYLRSDVRVTRFPWYKAGDYSMDKSPNQAERAAIERILKVYRECFPRRRKYDHPDKKTIEVMTVALRLTDEEMLRDLIRWFKTEPAFKFYRDNPKYLDLCGYILGEHNRPSSSPHKIAERIAEHGNRMGYDVYDELMEKANGMGKARKTKDDNQLRLLG